MIAMKLKRKYQPNPNNPTDYWAKKNGAGSDDGRQKKRNKTGVKSYDRTKHILYVFASGKKRMIHE